MQQCSHCQYFVPKGYLNCPQCSMPLASGSVTVHSVYSGKSGGGSRKNPTAIVIGVGLALVAIVAMTFVVRGGGDKKFVDNDTLAAPTPDGWRNFSAPDGAFTASFPGVPERSEKPLDSLSQISVRYAITQGDFEFGVTVVPAPAYIAPFEAGKRLEEMVRPTYEAQGATIEGATQLLTPRGDQALDMVVLVGDVRAWIRFTTWNGSIIRVYATLPAAEQPSGTQSETYRRLRDSIRQ
jgi:hypothetical protein